LNGLRTHLNGGGDEGKSSWLL